MQDQGEGQEYYLADWKVSRIQDCFMKSKSFIRHKASFNQKHHFQNRSIFAIRADFEYHYDKIFWAWKQRSHSAIDSGHLVGGGLVSQGVAQVQE